MESPISSLSIPIFGNRRGAFIQCKFACNAVKSTLSFTYERADLAVAGDFDKDKFYLGKLCKNGHEWENSGKSLKRKSGRNCCECHREHTKIWRANNLEKSRQLRREQYWKDPEKSRSQSRDSYQKDADNIRAKARISNNERYHRNIEENRRKKREAYWTDPEKRRAESRVIRLSNPERYKEYAKKQYWADPERHREQGRRYYKENSERGKQRTKEWRLENPERRRQYNRKRRALARGSVHVPHTPEQLQARYLDFDQCCAYCGNDYRLVADHFIALAKGGHDGIDNIVPACLNCNNSKQATDPLLWYRRQSFFSEERWQKILSALYGSDNTLPVSEAVA